ncbi:MAG: hypothetical protein IPK13_00355 [Deltaproteobacteria bacterium]|nr:hypothetical protein [Deltaproteobacteria bacterium]
MTKENKKRMRIMEELRLPELQARFHDIVGEATRSPNKKFLLRRIAEALEAQEQEAAEAASAVAETDPTALEPATANGEPKLSKLTVEELQQLYTEVVGRDTGSSDKRYVELANMCSRRPASSVLPRRTPRATPHNRAAFGGRMTLRSPRREACMATSAGLWRSQGERA